MSDVQEIAEQLQKVRETVKDLSRSSIGIRDSFTNAHHQLDRAVKKLHEQKKEFKSITKEIRQLKQKGTDTTELENTISTTIEPELQDLSQRLVPLTGSLFVRLFLGRVNVKVYKDGERVRLKSEYEKFRSRTNPFIILAGILQLIFPRLYIAQAIFQIWLLYYYVTLALREHILKVNGSNINRWWMAHHYVAMLTSIVILTWNWDNAGYKFFYPQMMIYTICQGSVQILMNRYQIGRLYNLVARGEASRMDVTAEIVDSRFVPSMTVLMPFLLMVQLFQGYNGIALLYFYYHHQSVCSWQVVVVAILFLILSAGNLWTTLGTFIRKKVNSSKQVLSAAVVYLLMSEEEAVAYVAALNACACRPPASTWSRIVFNYKEWESERGEMLERYCRHESPNRYLSDPAVELCAVGEQLGTFEGSACAIINTLQATLEASAANQLALLAAGEGSRLWAVSATNGFVKALTKVFSSTLFEQTINQCCFLVSQAPLRANEGLTFIAGTDNILLPSVSLCAVDGRLFKDIHEGNLFFFSKEMTVLSEDGEVINSTIIPALEQLGIMIVDSETSHPIEFMEKVSGDIILRTLQQHNKRSVFFNAFVFACTKKASATLCQLYSQTLHNSSTAFFECKDFDWSAHVLEPLAISSSKDSKEKKKENWHQRWVGKNRRVFPNEIDWMSLLTFAEEFIQHCGSPVVINLGEDAIWYDTGMCKDIYELHQSTISPDENQRNIIRNLLSLPTKKNSPTCDQVKVCGNSLIVDSVFRKGGQIGESCIIVQSQFEEEVNIPPGVVVINSRFHKLLFSKEINKVLIYGYDPQEQESTLLIEHNESVYCSIHDKDESIFSGCFPLSVVPKEKSQQSYFNHYHVGNNYDKSFLEQSLLGIGLSFRELQEKRLPTLSYLIQKRETKQ